MRQNKRRNIIERKGRGKRLYRSVGCCAIGGGSGGGCDCWICKEWF